MMKKYELVPENTVNINGKTLYQIRSLISFETISFGEIRPGDLGGYVESEDNLSQEGTAWISGNSCVLNKARVSDKGVVCDTACVSDFAEIKGHAVLQDNAHVFGEATVCESSLIGDNARVGGKACICGDSSIRDFAIVDGTAYITGNSYICNTARISSSRDFLTVYPIGDDDFITLFKTQYNRIAVFDGVFAKFYGTINKFEKHVNDMLSAHGDDDLWHEYLSIIELAKIHIKL